jgi:hypothetical protein
MTRKTPCGRRMLVQRGVPLIVAAAISACAGGGGGTIGGTAGSVVQTYGKLAGGCQGRPLNGIAFDDLSGSDQDWTGLRDNRLRAIQDQAMRVAACTGTVKAVGFSHSVTDTVALGAATFEQARGTDNARYIAADKRVGSYVKDVTATLGQPSRLATGGTDVLGMLTLAQQFASQVRGPLDVLVLTDGIQVSPGLVMGDGYTTTRAATDAAAVPVPTLSGATVRIVGVGRVGGSGSNQPTSERTAAVTAFWQAVCARTGAAHCQVVSDYASPAGR